MVKFPRFGYVIWAVLVSNLLVGGANAAFFQSSLSANTPISFPFPVTQAPICSYDVTSDSSFQKYLSDTAPFANKKYVPSDLLPINSSFTANDPSKFKLREEAGVQFADLAWHFWKEFDGDKLVVVSAYRSSDFQKYLFRNCRKNACAQAGTSEHQAGLALDLSVRTKPWSTIALDQDNKYHDWLLAHAHEFGFHNTYQRWVSIDGKIIEPRHRRYMWIDLASLLHNNQQTFAERMNTQPQQTSCSVI